MHVSILACSKFTLCSLSYLQELQGLLLEYPLAVNCIEIATARACMAHAWWPQPAPVAASTVQNTSRQSMPCCMHAQHHGLMSRQLPGWVPGSCQHSSNNRRHAPVAKASRQQPPSAQRRGSKLRKPFQHAGEPGSRPPAKPHIVEEEEVEVPDVGWLWNVGSSQQQTADSNGLGKQPSALRTVADLRKDRIDAKKSLGQNFLTDDAILRDIVAAAGVVQGDLVLEVGPGTGNLTKHLLAAGALVTAVEKDDTLYARLAEQYAQVPQLNLIHGDVLRIQPSDLLQRILERASTPVASAAATAETTGAESATDTSIEHAGAHATVSRSTGAEMPTTTPGATAAGRKIKIVANLPYNITTDFLKAMMPQGNLVSELHIMLQDEAGQRLVRSGPGDKDYRAMSLRVALYSVPKYRFRIAKEKYYPVPGVDGALVSFLLTPPAAPRRASLRLPGSGERGLLAAIEKAFSERRKMLRNSLQPLYTVQQVEAALQEIGAHVTARAQDLSLTQWAALYRAMHARVLQDMQPSDNNVNKASV